MRHFVACVLLLCFWAGGCLATEASDQETWKSFLAWYKTYTGPPYPTDLLKAYAASLSSAGKSEAEVKEALQAVRTIGASNQPEMMRLHFNKVYTIHQDLFSQEPSGIVVRTVRGVKPGKVLDVGMGQGRNSVFLAREGWDVTGYDLSDEGLAKARQNAAAAGVRIDTIQSTHDKFDYGKDRWDLIVMTYALTNMSDSNYLARVKASLKPGGLIVVEQPNSGDGSKGPANALFRSFEDLRVIHYEDAIDVAEWSKKPGRIGRIVVQKD